MKTILFLLIFLCIPESLLSQEYGPHAKLFFKAKTELRTFSGVVIDSPEDKIQIITCWHGTMGFQHAKTITAQIFCPTVDNTQLSVVLNLTVVKSEEDKDVLLLSGPNTLNLKIKRLKIADDRLSPNIKTKSYGYTELSTNLITNDSSPLDYDSTSVGGSPILHVRALAISGMSGGGLMYNDILYGIQSVGDGNRVGYCPSDQILLFLKK